MPNQPTPLQIATWRYEQIAPLLDESLSSAQQRRLRQDLYRRATAWPSGKTKPIRRATIQRWVSGFKQHGFVSLIPKPRKDRGTQRRDTKEIIDHAIALLIERPQRSLYLISRFLAQKFEGYDLSRATLARHLKAREEYRAIEKARGQSDKLRGRYEAQEVHESWQLDGKGPFRVHFIGGDIARFHILAVLDDHSRGALAGIVSKAENETAAIRVFQKAALRYGLPDRMQFDRGSAFDSQAFRSGLAQLGVHRNAVRPKNPRAQGKIEAFNKSLGRWFIDELALEKVRDLEHLEELLDAFLAQIYQKHFHRSIKTTPETRLGGRVSKRQVSAQDLARAFFVSHSAKSDRTTGEVSLPNGRFLVPKAYAGKRSRFLCDPLSPRALLVTDDDREIELKPFAILPLPKPVLPDRAGPPGQLQRILDDYQGRRRDNTEPAFGLPEIFHALGELVTRTVPTGESEAELVLAFWKRFGPIASAPFRKACESVRSKLGQGRALSAYLDQLARCIEADRASSKRKESP